MCKRPKSSRILNCYKYAFAYLSWAFITDLFRHHHKYGEGMNKRQKQNQSHKNLVKNYHYAIKLPSFSISLSLSHIHSLTSILLCYTAARKNPISRKSICQMKFHIYSSTQMFNCLYPRIDSNKNEEEKKSGFKHPKKKV